ncbi:MAG: endolytic transglycosylase MltG [Rothia sp. (in: high G+C Gram-positive bacteria)]|nr:endolytic transglycosylase MltG [Rothia sp. (in: high G+C Gram-positive bacteria)]
MSDNTNLRHSRPPHHEPDNFRSLLEEPRPEDHILGIAAAEDDEIRAAERQRVRVRRRNTLFTAILVFGLALVMIVAILSPQMGWFKRKDYRGDGNGTQISYTVQTGSTNYQIAADLEEKGIIADAKRFLDTYDEMNTDLFFQPGEYSLEEQMSSEAALNVLLDRENENKVYIAIDQTLRMDETLQNIANATNIPYAELDALNANVTQFGIPDKFPNLEGWLHPGEYRFEKGVTAKEVIQTLVDQTKKDLKEAGVEGDEHIFHVITVASILEFEGLPKDYGPIAGAIENRMNNPDGETSGYIQSDATVAYGLGEKTYHLTEEQKLDASNKYNTFYYKGLPVGPIGSPALDSIKAAANPEKNNYYFWVTVNLDTGETLFADTYEEHLKNVEIYDKWCSENEGKCT